MELLAQLRDIREPDPVGFWPLAPGWWILIALLLCALIALSIWLYRRKQQHRRNAYRREAAALLDQIDLQSSTAAQEINTLLKRVATHVYGRDRCAALTGPEWLAFLQSTADLKIPEATVRLLSAGIYAAGTERGEIASTEIESTLNYARVWIHLHRAEEAQSQQQEPQQQQHEPTQKEVPADV
ncbi:DUF4381 domain-containing protein [Biformimicrobium ophioploci]|uniref:DUF4381 domain-containing protein n=2 Tax=Biformimicrobium ophioploci TaxID=3036711 RepID=A0ABQ6M1T8_9GAMM|nr:DUF4381 domain-containing protein [Microbulbifer sp. NKW57]